MKNKRINYHNTPIGESLFNEVDGFCPICSSPLHAKKKGGKRARIFDIAHIYPLNPSLEEFKLLVNEEKLSHDVNHEDNLIALCKNCHKKYDTYKQVSEYRDIVALKKRLQEQSCIKDILSDFQIDDEIRIILDNLTTLEIDEPIELELTPKKIKDKIGVNLFSDITRKIQNNINDYYPYVKEQYALLEKEHPYISDSIASRFKTNYLHLKRNGYSYHQIYENLTNRLHKFTNNASLESCYIVVAFHIQNCEIF